MEKTKKHFTTSQEEIYYFEREQAIELLWKTIKWIDNEDNDYKLILHFLKQFE